MNYYSEDIINNIIDTSDVDKIITNLEEFKSDIQMLFYYFSFYEISFEYIDSLFANENNKVAFRCIDNSEFNIRNCPSAMIYRKCKCGNTVVYYIYMICTKNKFKKLGYASALFDDFIKKIKNEKDLKYKDCNVKIVLSSLDDAVSYYMHYGFTLKSNDITDYPVLMLHEKYEEDKTYYIMELEIE
jgi:hypothetical protein